MSQTLCCMRDINTYIGYIGQIQTCTLHFLPYSSFVQLKTPYQVSKEILTYQLEIDSLVVQHLHRYRLYKSLKKAK